MAKQNGVAKPKRASRAVAKAPEEAPAEVATKEVAEAPKEARPRLLEFYRSEVMPTMMQEFSYDNVMQVPRLQKVVLNVGLGEALTNPKAIESATKDLTTISGQKPVVTRARNSIAGFKLREGNPIGVTVTLRGVMMYHFVDRLLNAALPRIRDFRGVSLGSFDGRGNYSMGIREQIIFPEIEYGQIERIRGFQVSIITSARTDGEAARLLALLGMPFAHQN
jgi:large subunit ribosomal protein L5